LTNSDFKRLMRAGGGEHSVIMEEESKDLEDS
jgi:hypothetical protein